MVASVKEAQAFERSHSLVIRRDVGEGGYSLVAEARHNLLRHIATLCPPLVALFDRRAGKNICAI
jgi:hypothetical protein